MTSPGSWEGMSLQAAVSVPAKALQWEAQELRDEASVWEAPGGEAHLSPR